MGTVLVLCLISMSFTTGCSKVPNLSSELDTLLITGGRRISDLEQDAYNGSITAQLALVKYYRSNKNQEAELRFLKMAADSKHPAAMKELALHYQKSGEFVQATRLHIEYVKATDETSLAKEWLAELVSSGEGEKLSLAISLAEVMISWNSDQIKTSEKAAILKPLRAAVKRFCLQNNQNEKFQQAFELQRDFRIMMEKFPELAEKDDNQSVYYVPNSPQSQLGRHGQAIATSKQPERPKIIKPANSALPKNKPAVQPKQKKRQIHEELKKIDSQTESVQFIQQNWLHFEEILKQKSSFTSLQSEISQQDQSFTKSQEKELLIVKCQFSYWSVRYFFRNFKEKAKKDNSALCKIEVIPDAKEFQHFNKDLQALFNGEPSAEHILQADDYLWACSFKLTARVQTIQENNLTFALCQPAEVKDFRYMTFQEWLKKVKPKINSNGYIKVENKKATEYYLPNQEDFKSFVVTTEKRDGIIKEISSTDTAAGKIFFNIKP